MPTRRWSKKGSTRNCTKQSSTFNGCRFLDPANPGVPGFGLQQDAVFSHLRISSFCNIDDDHLTLSTISMVIEVDSKHM